MSGEFSQSLGEAEAGPAERSGPRAEIPLRPIVTFLLVWLGGSWLVVNAWLSSVIPGGWTLFFGGVAAGSFAFWTLVRGFRRIVYPSASTRLLVLRPFWYALFFLPLLAIATLIGGLTGLPFGQSRAAGLWALGIAGGLLGAAALAGYLGTKRLTVKRLEARLPGLPVPLDGLRVVQLSDLHVGPHTPRGFLRRIVEQVGRQEPHLIAITGDMVDDFAHDVQHFNAAFAELNAPLGVYAIPGNHDVYAGWEAVERGLTDSGFRVLVNEAVAVEHDGQRFWVAGTGDPAASRWPGADAVRHAPHIGRTLEQVAPGEFVLALAHNPGLWPALADRNVDLTLSGHTHYGQLALPGLGWSMASMFLEHAMGWHREGASLLYINPGTNFWGIPFRIGALPEVTVLTLRAGAGGEAGIVEVLLAGNR